MKHRLHLSLRWKVLTLITFILIIIGIEWRVQFNKVMQTYQHTLSETQTHHFQRLINNSLKIHQAQLHDLTSWLPFLLKHRQEPSFWNLLEAQLINNDIQAIYQITPQQQLRPIYLDTSKTKDWTTSYLPSEPEQFTCQSTGCDFLFNLHAYGADGTPLNLFVVQKANLWFQTLHQLLNNPYQWLLITEKTTTGLKLKLTTQYTQTYTQLWSHLTPLLQHKHSIQTIQLNHHDYLLMPLTLPVPQTLPANLHMWAIQDITHELTSWQALKQHSSLQLLMSWFFITGLMLIFISRWLNSLNQIETALTLAAQNKFKLGAKHLKLAQRPLFIDELHMLLLNGRKMLIRMGQLTQQLEWMAYHDTLTKLPNRRLFYIDLKKMKQRQKGTLLFLDLNHFKQINDVYGHKTGDAILRDLAKRLKNLQLPTQAKAYRLAGDEFTLILPEVHSHTQLTHLLIQLSQQLNGTLETSQKEKIYYQASIGAVILEPSMTQPIDKLLHWADIAMYKAKHENSSQRWYIFNPIHDDDTLAHREELKLIAYMRSALNSGFEQVIQPIATTQNGEIHHYEVLLRLNDAQGHPISPAQFIPIAEHHGLIYDIDRWVLEHALIALKEIPSEIHFSVNLSAPSLQHPQMAQIVLDLLKQHQVPAHRLVIELTETAYVENLNQVKINLTTLKSAGVQLSLDDFGVGFTSFSYLTELHFDYIKIDGSYIKDLLHNPAHQAFVKGITQIVHASELKVIAEFVENEEILQYLQHLHIDYAQGWCIGKPQPIHQVFP